MSRRPIMAGNWKMNKTPSEAADLARALRRNLSRFKGVDVVLGPPFVSIPAVAEAIANSPLEIAAQNLHWEDKGAYTGEISGPMIAELGCTYVIIGHSERRQHFGETDETVNKRIRAAFAHGLLPIVCIGETLDEREAGQTRDRVESQLGDGLAGFDESDLSGMVLAYEPVWAIGTGRTATTEQAQEVHEFIRSFLAKRFSAAFAEKTRIQYGGSVKAANVAALMAQPDIDGALVGGASLTAESFSALVENGIVHSD